MAQTGSLVDTSQSVDIREQMVDEETKSDLDENRKSLEVTGDAVDGGRR